VHRGVLASHSEKFKDIEGEKGSECPIVKLDDCCEDIFHLLKALYGWCVNKDPSTTGPS
jgi:hypothetical protein